MLRLATVRNRLPRPSQCPQGFQNTGQVFLPGAAQLCIMPGMSPIRRRILQAILYEGIAIAVVTPTLVLVFSHPPGSAFALSAVMSGIAMAWTYVFNTLFERWESVQSVKGRSLVRRLVHGLGFECGLTVFLLPLMAYWLDVSLLAAFLADIGLLAFFFVYTIVFTWAFDRVFGLPLSAQGAERAL